MKKEIYLTKEEKIDFLAELENTDIVYDIKHTSQKIKTLIISCGIAAIAGGALSVLFGISSGVAAATMLSTVLPVDLILSGIICVGTCTVYGSQIPADIKKFNKLTNGKITYRDYKKLLKSGEIDKWKNEYAKEIEQKVMELESFTVEDYQSEIEDNIISEVEDLIADEKVKLDSARIAEEVKKRIDEHNERQC